MEENKYLICWNKGDYADILKQRENFVVCTDFEELKSFEIDKRPDNYKGIIVLCELSWSDRGGNCALSELKGVELVQHYFRFELQLHHPIIFISFLNRNRILKIDPSKDIVCAEGLHHGFRQLPSQPEEWIDDLDKLGFLSDLELIDTMHFCTIADMAAEIRHDATGRNLTLEELKTLVLKIKHLITNTANLSDLNIDTSEIDALVSNNEIKGVADKVKEICDALEKDATLKTEHQDDGLKTTGIKVLWLEDEPETIRKITANKEAIKYFDFTTVSTPEEFFKEIEQDEENTFSVIICDNRIWGKDSDGAKVLLKQGYTCLEELVKNYPQRYYRYVLVSELPRNFKIRIAEHLRFNIINKSKSRDLSDIKEFIYFLRRESDNLQEEIGKKGFTNANFVRFYNYLKTNKRNDIPSFREIENDITDRSLQIIYYYKEHNVFKQELKDSLISLNMDLRENNTPKLLLEKKIKKCIAGMFKLARSFSANEKLNLDDFKEALPAAKECYWYCRALQQSDLFTDTILKPFVEQYNNNMSVTTIKRVLMVSIKNSPFFKDEASMNSILKWLEIDTLSLKSNDQRKSKDYKKNENIDGFISKLIARRLAIYLYQTGMKKGDICKLFGKNDGGFLTEGYGLDLDLGYETPQTWEEERFFRKYFPKI